MNKQTITKEESDNYQLSIPEPGQLVEVRRRQWVVSDVIGSDGDGQDLVSLSSLDEDSIDEELQVVWQLEPGARVLEKAGLPTITGWDSGQRLEAFLDAVKWGAGTNADRSFLQAPFRSGITIEDYQLDPLVRAVDMVRVNLLIADDVGLGKTIEAGLVVQELLVRHRARTVLVVCPASLQINWQTEMWEKFGLEFRIVNTEYVKELRRSRGIHANPWTSFPRLITSMDWFKSGEGSRTIKDVLPSQMTYPRKFDILIIDEAHNVAPASASRYALESQRTRSIRTISPHFEHRLFLTATPHNGYQESFTSLLELLDDQRFARTVMPDPRQLHQVMIRRMKSDIVDADGNPVFPTRNLECLEIDYSEEERSIHQLLREFTQSRSKSVKGNRYAYGTDFVHMLLKKRLFSCPMSFATTLAKYRESLARKRSGRKDSIMDDRILRKAILRTEEEYENDEQVEEAQNEAVTAASELAVSLDDKQQKLLDELTKWAELNKHRVDSKAQAVLNWLEKYLKNDGEWNDKRVILFTEYRSTLVWLEQIFVSHDFGGERLKILHGSIDPKEREHIKAAFQAHPDISPVRILLATDAASEGINLQNYCNYLIHIEIPWNTNVMEQRNGRIDRHGQKEKDVYIWHPVGKGFHFDKSMEKEKVGELEGDHEYLMRAVLKVDNIRQDLGSVGPVIVRQIEEAMLGKRRNLDTKSAEEKASKARKFITAEKKLQERIARLHERLMEAKTDFHLSPENILSTVTIALELAEKLPLKSISFPGVPEGAVFEVPILPGTWGRATAGLEHPHTGQRRPVTFDHDVAKGRDDIVLMHLNHRLVQMCLRLLREELWKLDDVKKLHRVSFAMMTNEEIEMPIFAVYSRLVITGGDQRRLHEEITLSGGELKSSGFARITGVGMFETLVEKTNPFEPDEKTFEDCKHKFAKDEEAILASVEARSRDRLKYLENTLLRRKEKDIADLNGILNELEKNINSALKEHSKPKQLELWNDDEVSQLNRDVESLRARLVRIPDERKCEKAIIERRYANLTSRTFPVAVVFLIPKSYIRK